MSCNPCPAAYHEQELLKSNIKGNNGCLSSTNLSASCNNEAFTTPCENQQPCLSALLTTEGVPSSVQTGMIFAVNDVVAPVFRDFVTPALQSGQPKCLPSPTVVGKGLEYVDEALKMSKTGVSATKLVVEL